jgi:hypothetical protein
MQNMTLIKNYVEIKIKSLVKRKHSFMNYKVY